MNASEIMSSPVITVGPNTVVRHIAGLLLKHRISAVPVVDNGKLAGIVSEGDLIHRYEIGTQDTARSSSWWLQLFSTDRSVAEYVKSHATRARDIMTKDVVCVTPETPVAQIALLFERRHVKRVPVLEGVQLVGIVSRSDLVRALAAKAGMKAGNTGDAAIHKRLSAELERRSWWRSLTSNVVVTDGIVHYFGTIDSEDERQAARVAAENVPGVRGVHDHRVPIAAISWSV
jgi:CBS domain-containing protein